MVSFLLLQLPNTMPTHPTCPCQSGQLYHHCCRPFHTEERLPETAEQLMRSRYCAYALKQITYIIATTVPAQQSLLNPAELLQWSRETEWIGLNIVQHLPHIHKNHAEVEFEATLRQNQQHQLHRERSHFVHINQRWYFIDPTVALPARKHACLCGSAKKFKQCCGYFLTP